MYAEKGDDNEVAVVLPKSERVTKDEHLVRAGWASLGVVNCQERI